MELHRLKTMKEGYDVNLFNKLYKETEPLRKSLTYQIDCRRLGITPDVLLSWFDDKFIFVFNRYSGELTPGQLKGRLINSLKRFKYRVLRGAVYNQNNLYPNQVRLDDDNGLINIIPIDNEITNHDLFLEMALKYLKKNLCDDAFLVLELELNPPPYIMSSMVNPNTKIPSKLIAEYLDLEPLSDGTSYVNDLRSELSYWTKQAKEHFISQ